MGTRRGTSLAIVPPIGGVKVRLPVHRHNKAYSEVLKMILFPDVERKKPDSKRDESNQTREDLVFVQNFGI